MKFRHISILVACALILDVLVSRAAMAQTYPAKPITIIVSFAPGGFVDSISRMIGQKLSQRFKLPVVIENRPGAGGNIAHRAVAHAAADGYTILAASSSIAINATLYAQPGYSPNELTTVAIFASTPEILVTHPGGPKSLWEVVDLAKVKPLNFATAGAGSASSIVVSYFFKEFAKSPATHVPFQGGAPALSATLAGHVDLMGAAMAGGLVPQIQSGALRALAIAGETRAATVPNVPTYSESGYPGLIAVSWAGFFLPAGTSPDVAEKLNAAINDIMKEPDVLSKIQPAGFDAIYGPTQQADDMFRADIKNWTTMIGAVGMKIH
jgi:tripartite-type tricarboxylate transporter receptor subunit TctC